MVLSVFWGMVGVATIVIGLRRDLGVIRVAGLALLGVTIGKVFLFDLATLTAMYRVVSLVALGLLLLGLFLRSQDPSALAAALAGVSPGWIVPAIAVYMGGIWLRAARWRLLMAPFADVSTARLFKVILTGLAVNNILPLRLGELVRTFLLKQSHGVPIASSLATVLIERVLDLLALCGLMTLVLLLVPLDGVVLALAGTAAVITAGGLVGLAIITVVPRHLVDRLFGLGIALADRIHHRLGSLARSIVDGVRVLENRRALLAIVPLSLLCWLAELGLYVCLMFALGFNADVLGLVAGMVIANFVTVLPSAPGYVGTFDLPLQIVLTEVFDVPLAQATSYTLVLHAALVVPVVLLGLFFLWQDRGVSGQAAGAG
jgi:uncharacterized protein (TIRG00374 family)